MALTFIPASVMDAPQIREMAEMIWRKHYPGIISERQIDYMLDWMYAPERLRHEISSERSQYVLFRLDGETVGFAAWGPGEADLEMHLHKFYLLPCNQGKGLGSEGLKLILAEAEDQGAYQVSLRVNRKNQKALRCYERNGFEISHEVCSEIGDGFVMDDYWMVRTLLE